MRMFFEWLKVLFTKSGLKAVKQYWTYYRDNTEWKILKAKSNGVILEAIEMSKTSEKSRCNHHKGGSITKHRMIISDGQSFTTSRINEKLIEQGDDMQYSTIKHTFPWGDTWVRCLRCGKWWKPGDLDYDKALKFYTRNSPSSSIQFRGNDAFYAEARKLTENS